MQGKTVLCTALVAVIGAAQIGVFDSHASADEHTHEHPAPAPVYPRIVRVAFSTTTNTAGEVVVGAFNPVKRPAIIKFIGE